MARRADGASRWYGNRDGCHCRYVYAGCVEECHDTRYTALYLLNSIAGQSRFLDGIIVFLASYLAYLLPVMLLAFVFFFAVFKTRKMGNIFVAAISSIIARAGITELIRSFYHRLRPFVDLPVHQLLMDSAWSFPSGHATFFLHFRRRCIFITKSGASAFLSLRYS